MTHAAQLRFRPERPNPVWSRVHAVRVCVFVAGCAAGCLGAGPAAIAQPSAAPRVGPPQLVDRPDDWFRSDEGRRIVDNIVSWQNANGGWWKNYDAGHPRPDPLPPARTDDGAPGDTEDVWRLTSTFDNGATYNELRVLARAYRCVGDERYRHAFDRGLTFVLAAQYPNGGWPQRFPLRDNYGRHITFNDGAMTGVLRLLKAIADHAADYPFVTEDRRRECAAAYARGVQCILDCQVRVNGRLTAWCQQHDAKTLQPAGARTYELPSLTGDESADIVLLLMDEPQPDDRIRTAVDAAVAWYRSTEIRGLRVDRVKGPQYENGEDRIVVEDAAAGPLWARFYDIGTNRPFFASRDGTKRASLAEISWERRNHYSWYGTWGKKVYEAYARWQRRVGAAPSDR
jgi:pectate lyase